MSCFIIGITRSRPGGCELFDFRVRFWFGVVADFVVATRVCCGSDEHMFKRLICVKCVERVY